MVSFRLVITLAAFSSMAFCQGAFAVENVSSFARERGGSTSAANNTRVTLQDCGYKNGVGIKRVMPVGKNAQRYQGLNALTSVGAPLNTKCPNGTAGVKNQAKTTQTGSSFARERGLENGTPGNGTNNAGLAPKVTPPPAVEKIVQ